jgi:hypothetical protein
MLHAGRVEGRAPAALVVLRELQIKAWAVHAHRDVADAGPRVEPGSESPERPVVGGQWACGKSDCCPEELAALVEHGLLDDLVRSQEKRLRDCESKSLRGLEVDQQLELGWLLDGEVSWLGALENSTRVISG